MRISKFGNPMGRKSGYSRLFLLIALMVLVASAILSENLFSYGPALVNRLKSLVAAKWFHLICVAAILILGVGFYFFRSRQPKLYGLAECAFALVTAWNAADSASALGQTNFLALIAAAYLMVRGITHFQQGNRSTEPGSP